MRGAILAERENKIGVLLQQLDLFKTQGALILALDLEQGSAPSELRKKEGRVELYTWQGRIPGT